MTRYSLTDRIRAAYATYGSDMTAEAALKKVDEDKIGDKLDYAVLKGVLLELTDGAIRSHVSHNARIPERLIDDVSDDLVRALLRVYTAPIEAVSLPRTTKANLRLRESLRALSCLP